MDIILDTTVIIHLLQGQEVAFDWLNSQENVAITSITWMEVLSTVTNRMNQVNSTNSLSQFEIQYLTISDQQWAMEQLERYQLSHQIGMNDCQIASVAYRLQIPLYTHNLKDMTLLLGNLAQKPY